MTDRRQQFRCRPCADPQPVRRTWGTALVARGVGRLAPISRWRRWPPARAPSSSACRRSTPNVNAAARRRCMTCKAASWPGTGAAGFIGKSLIAELARLNKNSEIVALDMREVPADERLSNVTYLTGDGIRRDPGRCVSGPFVTRPQPVVHLASVVAVGGDPQRDLGNRRARHQERAARRTRCRCRTSHRNIQRLGLRLSCRQSGAAARNRPAARQCGLSLCA